MVNRGKERRTEGFELRLVGGVAELVVAVPGPSIRARLRSCQ